MNVDQEYNGTSKTIEAPPSAMRRRGLVAGAAALVAGLIVKSAETAQVGASFTAYTTPANFAAPQGADYQNYTVNIVGNQPLGHTTVDMVNNPDANTGSGRGKVLYVQGNVPSSDSAVTIQNNVLASDPSGTVAGTALYSFSYGGNAVFGKSLLPPGATTTLPAVAGQGANGPGVYGNASGGADVNGAIGVFGNGGAGSGVYGQTSGNPNYSAGVQGFSTTGYGMYGSSNAPNTSSKVAGVAGASAHGDGVYGNSAVAPGTGSVSADGTFFAGVRGEGGAAGVVGYSATGYGVVGSVGAGAAAALYGSSGTANTPAFSAYNGAAGGLAGIFNGQVYINGNYTATGTKSAAVPHPDGSHRLLYCMESPESWFEDFGEGTITAGKADVKLDPDFAAVVDTTKLHVFLTPHAGDHALHLDGRSATGFTVGATPSTAAAAAGRKAGDLNGAFTYRVVAKRKDVEAPRLAKFDLPKIPAPPATPKGDEKPFAPLPTPPVPKLDEPKR